MKKTLLAVLILLFCSKGIMAQAFESDDDKPTQIHVVLGTISYSGDLKKEKYSFNQSKNLFGLGLQKYLSNKISLRTELCFGKIYGDDKFSTDKARLKRNLNFNTNIIDGSLLMQYDLFKLGHDFTITPYVFGGVGYFHYNPFAYDSIGNKLSMVTQNAEGTTYHLNQFNLATGAGIKMDVSKSLQFALEFNSKILFTDYLDGISKRGNTNNKDNYYYAAAHIIINLSIFNSNQIVYYTN